MLLDEQAYGTLDPLDDRSCYPESKRAAETLLKSYLSPGQAPMIGFATPTGSLFARSHARENEIRLMREDAILPNNQTRHGQLSHQESANCHIKTRPTATSRISQLSHQESANCHIYC